MKKSNRQPRTYIRKYPKNPDYWEVMVGSQSKGRHLKKSAAKKQLEAIRRVRAKRAKRAKKG